MKKLQKIAIILVIGIVIVFTVLNYMYQQITPRTLGQSAFPLKEKWSLCVDEDIRDVSTNEDGKVFAKTNASLSVYDQDTGILVWKAPIKKQRESFPPIATDGRVFVSDSEQLWAFDFKTGRTLWKAPLDNTDTWVPDASGKFVLLNSISDRIYAYDAISGSLLWETLGGRGYTQAYIDHDTVYIVDRGIKALDAPTGEILWQLDNNRVTGVSAFGDGIIYYTEYPVNETFDLVAYSAKIQSELWRINFANYDPAATRPSGIYIHDNLLFMTQYGVIYRINPENGNFFWKKEFYNPKDLSFIGKNIYVLDPLERTIHALDIESGADIGSLQISFYQLITGIHSQKMTSTGRSLVFGRGCEVFVYGN